MTSTRRSEQRRRVAVVEPYLGGSHRAWAEGYRDRSVHRVEVFGLPAVHWKWRMQGGHVTIADRLAESVASHGGVDTVVASSMTDLAGLLGIARRTLSGARAVLYLHENQLTFPRPEHDRDDLTYAMINWTSMLAADVVVFNSAFHRDQWFRALGVFLDRLPDHRHSHLVDRVSDRSIVLPVGVDLASFDSVDRRRLDRPLVLWNHRWEYDKDPAAFVDAVDTLIGCGHDFDVAVAGARPARPPDELVRLRHRLGDRLVHDGPADPDDYRRLLRCADVVVSTAVHEFFGVAIIEAVHAGAFPVLPDRLVYPERIPAELHGECLYDTAASLVERLAVAITDRDRSRRLAERLRPEMAQFDWSVVAPAYDSVLVGPSRVSDVRRR